MVYGSYTKKSVIIVLSMGLFFLLGCTKTTAPTTINSSPTITGTDVVSDTNEPQVAERQTYTNKVDRFSLQFPGTRTFQEKVFGSSVMFFTPLLSGDTIKENVGVMKKALDKNYTLDEYYALTKPELIKLISGFTEVSKESITVNDIDAQKLIYT